MFSSFISTTTLSLISFSTVYLLYKYYVYCIEQNSDCSSQKQIRNHVDHLLNEIENDPYNLSNQFQINSKILNNKIKIFAYSKLLNKSLE